MLNCGKDSLDDFRQLVDLGLPGEEGLAQEQLGKYATDGPEVDGGGVVGVEQDLGRPVPERDDDGRQDRAERVQAGEAKVGQLDHAVRRHEYVLRLQVPVDDAVAVEEVHSADDLEEQVLQKKETKMRELITSCQSGTRAQGWFMD